MHSASLRKFFSAILFVFLLSISKTALAASCPLNSANPSVTICQPANGATVSSPFRVLAGTTSSQKVTGMWVYLDNVAKFHSSTGTLDTMLTASAGTHTVLVKAWNSGGVFRASVQVRVSSSSGGGPDASLSTTSVNFGSQIVGTYSAAQKVLLTNNTDSTLNISSLALNTNFDFHQLSNCGVGLPAHRTCEVDVIFNPQSAGSKTDTLTIDYSGAGSPASVQIGGDGSPEAKPGIPINHILWIMQENRSFDSYFGKLNDYRGLVGLPQDVDGLTSNSNVAKDGRVVNSFHMASSCVEITSPGWDDSHRDVNRFNPSVDIGVQDGFVANAAGYAHDHGFFDQRGVRAMGYYDYSDLPYYYNLASEFATSDRWFSPSPTSTPPNRMYAIAATSHGVSANPTTTFNIPTIFDRLEAAGVSWKIYYTDVDNHGQPESRIFSFQPFANNHRSKIVPMSEYFTDLKNGTLPAVAMLDSGYGSGRDEHPGGTINGQPHTGTRFGPGAAYVASLINALMSSSAWHDSALVFTFDEGGGLYDHVTPPLNAVSPDGIKPSDLASNAVPGDFTRYGFRVPFFVASPYSKPHYVSHTPMDHTAILKLIETRFNLQALTARDAAQPDMLEFFDFGNPAWMTPPTPLNQPTDKPCDYTNIPE